MCGIFAYLGTDIDLKTLLEFFIKIYHRGPDNSNFLSIRNDLYFGFHRLRINGLDLKSNQPFHLKGCYLICNGEIYNFEKLRESYPEYYSSSDCEIIIHLYRRHGIERTLQMLDGVFAFILFDEVKNVVYAARDPIGIRPLFLGNTDNGIAFASEAKAITFCNDYKQFTPGSWWCSSKPNEINSYYSFDYKVLPVLGEEDVLKNIRNLFTQAVKKRLMSEREVGCLLSGGLDSTLVTALVANNYEKGKLRTYSIGMEGSVDLYWARRAAEYLETEHHEVCFTEEQFLEGIEKTIYQIESYCTTSVRASVGNYLISLYIKENTPDVVIYCGDVSDEIFGSYRGFMKAPNNEEFRKANNKIVEDVHLYDVLRSDRSISGAGLEARVPFADKDFLNYVMSLPPEYKMFNHEKMEKYYLRKAFDGYLPDELLWRRKEAFSDGVSSEKRSWFEIIKEFVESKISDEEYEELVEKYDNPKPYDKESLYYRMIYEKYYGDKELVPYYWRHPFCKIKDPSARLLDCY